MSLRSWWAERRSPALKCARVGHDERVETRTGWKSPEHSWHVMDKVREERHACYRCGHVISEWLVVDRDGFSSVSWPSELWDEYRSNGYERWTDHGWRGLTTDDTREPTNA